MLIISVINLDTELSSMLIRVVFSKDLLIRVVKR